MTDRGTGEFTKVYVGYVGYRSRTVEKFWSGGILIDTYKNCVSMTIKKCVTVTIDNMVQKICHKVLKELFMQENEFP